MIEIKVTISCEECGEEVEMDETELQEIANFGASLVFCYGLPPENLPNGFVLHEGDDGTYCEECIKTIENL